ncbi:MAG: hypothetical protein HZB41_15280 [Ignavibacteriae bacterium]|nr:hypothetical protein [Ignavibacteriota bacterium]
MLFTEDTINLSYKKYKNFSAVACIYTGFGFATQSVDFFKEYNSYFNKYTEQFKVTPVFGFALKYTYSDIYRFGFSVDYIGASLREYFDENFIKYNRDFSRAVGDNISITSVPVLLIAELKPFEQQFQGFVGIGAGIVYSSIDWDENISSNYSEDIRESSRIISEKKVYPTFRIYTGTELGFDRHSGSNFLGSLIIEAGYTFLVRYTDIYSNLTKQFSPVPEGWRKSYAIFPGYINLSIGLSFNIQRRDVK